MSIEPKMISVCTPYWQRQAMLDQMFATYERHYADLPIEFSVCDDGDPTPAHIPPYWFPAEPWAPYVVLTRLPEKDRPLNPCVPINKAIDSSTGELIVLTTPEIEHPVPVLKEMLQLFEHEDDYICARCRRENGEWLAGPEVAVGRGGRAPTPPGGYFHFLIMFHRKLWHKGGGYDEDYRYGQACDDNDWLWRAYEAGARFKVTQGVVVHANVKRISWNMPHNRDLFAHKWPPARRNALVERRRNEEGLWTEEQMVAAGGYRGPTNPGNRLCRAAEGDDSIYRGPDAEGVRSDGLVALSRDAQHSSVGPAQDGEQHGHAVVRERGTTVVERSLKVIRPPAQDTRARRAQLRRERRQRRGEGAQEPTGDHSTPAPEIFLRPEGRRRDLLHPEWALVLGGAIGVWDDVIAWEEMYGKQWDGVVVAANDVGCHWPRHLDHWATLHPDKFNHWEPLRFSYGFNTDYSTWARKARFAKHTVTPWSGGASGMLAIQVAQQIGCVRVILCGIPMAATPHFVESTVHVLGQPWKAVEGHWRAWQKHLDKIQGWVKSMSGRTQELLGAPTLEWLLDGKPRQE